ncbi:MAG: CRP-like cAMP-binding protein [Cognaticolwellia sp.]
MPDVREVLIGLSQNSLFETFSDSDLRELAQRFRIQRWEMGRTVCRAGDPASTFFVVVSGELEVFSPDRPRRKVNSLKAGDFLGEVGLLAGGTRSATVQVSRDATLLSLSAADFRELMLLRPQVVAQISQELARRLARQSIFPEEPQAPSLLAGRYRTQRTLGTGGMANVLLVRDERLGVDRALKLLVPRFAEQERARIRFEVEARTMAALRHRNIVTVHDVVVAPEHVFMVMEVATGGTLAQRMKKQGPLSPRFAVQTLISVLKALELAHSQRVVHRDVKPHNILFRGDGTPLLADFGIARLLDDGQALTRTGSSMGTQGYMAPEQRADARLADVSADIYGVGATLYAALTASTPGELFAKESQQEVARAFPEVLAKILHLATSYRPTDRYETATALRQAMERALPELDDTLLALPETPAGLGLTAETLDWARD